MNISKSDIEKYADNLLIKLNEEEKEKITSEFSFISKNMDLINEIEGIKEVEPMHMIEYLDEVILNLDEVETSLSREEVLKNCDDTYLDEVKVPGGKNEDN